MKPKVIKWPETEEVMAEPLVEWLKSEGWEVYQEVQVFSFGDIADIVAVKDGVYWIVECKKVFGTKVLEQGWGWKGYADKVSVAVPWRKSWSILEPEICKGLGMGLIHVNPPDTFTREPVTIRYEAPVLKEMPITSESLRKALNDGMKDFAKAGNASGDRWSPYKQTLANFVEFVGKNPGCTMREIVEGIEHHYSCYASATGALNKAVDYGWEKRVVRKITKNRYRYRLRGKEDA